MKARLTFIAAIIAVGAAMVASTGSAAPADMVPTLSKIAYFNYHTEKKVWCYDIFLVNTDGSGKIDITHNGTVKTDSDPNWSPDGKRIAFSRTFEFGGSAIMVVNADGTGLVNLTGPSLTIQNIHPTWSPDGSIVFASNRDGNFDLYKLGLKGVVTKMTKTEAPVQNLDPDYSSDGSMLVFSRVTDTSTVTDEQATSLFRMKASPYAPAYKVTEASLGTSDRGAAWSPDGSQIAFHSDRSGNSDIYLVNTDGSNLTQLTSGKSADREPSFSPDGRSLVFLSDRTESTELWMLSLMSATAGDPPAWQFTFDQEAKGAPDWQPAGPLGRPATS